MGGTVWNDEGDDYAKLPHAITHQWDWVETESPEQQIARALKWIQDNNTGSSSASEQDKKGEEEEGKHQSNGISY